MERYGIGEKGPVQKQIESDPYLKWINSGMRSTDYTPEIAAAKRRFIEKQQGAKQQPTYRDTGNVVRIETIEDTVPSERARPRPVTAGGMGGYSQGGLFKSDRGMGVVPDNVDTTSAPPDAPTDLLDAALDESDRYFGTRSPGDEMTAAWQAEQLRRRRAEAPYDLVTAAVGRNPAVVTSGYPARDFSRDPYLGGAGAGGLEMTRAAQRQAELNSASMDMPRGLFGNTWSTSTGTAPYSAERNWGQPGVYIGGGSPGEEIQAEMQRQAALESAGMDFNLPLNGSTYQTTTGTAPTPPVTNWGQTAFPYIGQSGAGGEEIMDAMPPAPPAFIDVQPAQSEAQYWRERLGTGFGGGSGADIQSSQATPVDRREFVTDYADSPMEVAANYTQVRNVRNNNPGNIKINKANAWQGRVSNKKEKTFETFKTPEYGVRALNRVVDANIKATKTFEEFVNRYASEPSEQAYYKKNGKLKPALQNYANALANSQGITNSKSKFPSNLDKAAWLRAIIKHEGGADALNYYTDDIINAGIQMK